MSGRMEFDFDLRRADSQRVDDTPFSVLVIGDYGGDHRSDAAAAPMRKVDVDNVDELWELFAPDISFEAAGHGVGFTPRDLDDFHPDQLVSTLSAFGELRGLRRRLLDPATADATLAEVLSSTPEPSPEPADFGTAPEAPAEDGDDMFSRLLGQPQQGSGATESAARSTIDNLVANLVAPHIVHEPNPHIDAAVDSVDRGMSDLMGAVLHHPAFQALEARWRALYDLVQGAEWDEMLELRVCSLSKDGLLNALPTSGAGFADSNIHRLLVDRFRTAADDRTPDLIVIDESFAPHPNDVALLAALGSVADEINATVIATAHPDTIGATDLPNQPEKSAWNSGTDEHPLWAQLRQAPFAHRIGLALPRLLARLPYGEATDPVSAFDYEEMTEPSHDQFLWANPSLALARLLAESWTENGAAMQPGGARDIGELPAFSYQEDGAAKMQPCAELLLPERSAEAILQKGMMAIASFRNQDMARLLRFQSMAEPLSALRGRWD